MPLENGNKKTFTFTVFLVCFIFSIASAIFLVLTIFRSFQPDQRLLLKDTRCRVVRAQVNGTEECDCGDDDEEKNAELNRDNEDCISTYPCLSVMVNYSARNAENEDTMMMSKLLDDQNVETVEQMKEKEQKMIESFSSDHRSQDSENENNCSLIPKCSSDEAKNNETVQKYRKKYGEVGLEFVCFYDPHHITKVQVWQHPERSKWDNRFLLYLLAMVLAIASTATSLTFKWYKMLMIQDQLSDTPPTVVIEQIATPSVIRTYSPTAASPRYPPPYSDKPVGQLVEEHHSESSLPPPYAGTNNAENQETTVTETTEQEQRL